MHSRIPLAFAFVLPAAAETTTQDAARLEFFETKVRPILSQHCYSCHSADTKAAGDLRVDDLNGLLNGGNNGPAVVPGDPDKSLLIQRLVHEQQRLLMPKESDPLSGSQIADLKTWIADGAAWPAEKIPEDLGKVTAKYDRLRKNHWAWQTLQSPALPVVKEEAWARGDIDRFVLAKLEAENLPPVKDADPVTLLRRLSFDLTGLPPGPGRIAAFIQDLSPAAYEAEVDRLLASPGFAERWGRHWLDVARYGESTGPSRNIPYPHAWKYRDYVLDAVARDIPFDRFIQEQIAGDLLPAEAGPERDRLLTATGFLALGVKDVNQRFKVRFQMDNVDEKIDTVTRSVLGLTVSCARCHDHKFDPVPITDYYSLAGIFTSTEDGAGVRNKMGGGGLDYYDPKNLIPLSTQPPPPPAEQVAPTRASSRTSRRSRTQSSSAASLISCFARQCLMARRLSEAGVRFVEICQPGWDHHNNLHKGLRQCRPADLCPAGGPRSAGTVRRHARPLRLRVRTTADRPRPGWPGSQYHRLFDVPRRCGGEGRLHSRRHG